MFQKIKNDKYVPLSRQVFEYCLVTTLHFKLLKCKNGQLHKLICNLFQFAKETMQNPWIPGSTEDREAPDHSVRLHEGSRP